jgi:hypothetical protein
MTLAAAIARRIRNPDLGRIWVTWRLGPRRWSTQIPVVSHTTTAHRHDRPVDKAPRSSFVGAAIARSSRVRWRTQ